MNPDRYVVIYNSKYDSDDNISNSSATIAPISSSSSAHSTPDYYYFNVQLKQDKQTFLRMIIRA
jgi:hypothetical protein